MPEEICEHCNGEGRIEIDINDARITDKEKRAFYAVCFTPGVHEKIEGQGDWFICGGSHVAPCPYCQKQIESALLPQPYDKIYCPVEHCKLLILDENLIIGCSHYSKEMLRAYSRQAVGWRQGLE